MARLTLDQIARETKSSGGAATFSADTALALSHRALSDVSRSRSPPLLLLLLHVLPLSTYASLDVGLVFERFQELGAARSQLQLSLDTGGEFSFDFSSILFRYILRFYVSSN